MLIKLTIKRSADWLGLVISFFHQWALLMDKIKGQHSISINEQWRICFRFIEGDAYDVEITDYH